MGKCKFAVIGCGATTRIMYGPILKYLGNGEYVAAVDPNPERLGWERETYGVRTYTDLDDMLESERDLDAVIIGSPTFHHRDQALRAAEAGLHILCEKPLARNLRECDDMISAADRSGVILMIAFMKRYNKCFRKAKEIVDSGELGDLIEIRMNWDSLSLGSCGWRGELRTLGGIFQDHGSHTIDLCRWWAGEIASVSGVVKIVGEGHEVENHVSAICRHESGVTSVHLMTGGSHKSVIENYEIYGTKGTLQMDFEGAWSYSNPTPFRMRLYRGGNSVTDITPRNHPNLDVELRENGQYLKELEHFCDCVLTGKRPLTTGEDGRKAIEVINAVYLSSFRNEVVKLPLEPDYDLEEVFRSMG